MGVEYKEIYFQGAQQQNFTLFNLNLAFVNIFKWGFKNNLWIENKYEWNTLNLEIMQSNQSSLNPQYIIKDQLVKKINIPRFIGWSQDFIIKIMNDFQNISDTSPIQRTTYAKLKYDIAPLIFNFPFVGTEMMKYISFFAVKQISVSLNQLEFMTLIFMAFSILIVIFGITLPISLKILFTTTIRKNKIRDLCLLPIQDLTQLLLIVQEQFRNNQTPIDKDQNNEVSNQNSDNSLDQNYENVPQSSSPSFNSNLITKNCSVENEYNSQQQIYDMKRDILLKLNVKFTENNTNNTCQTNLKSLKKKNAVILNSSHQESIYENNDKEDNIEVDEKLVAQQRTDDIERKISTNSGIISVQIQGRIYVGSLLTIILIIIFYVYTYYLVSQVNGKVGLIIINELIISDIIRITCFCTMYVSNIIYNVPDQSYILYPGFINSPCFNGSKYATDLHELAGTIQKLNQQLDFLQTKFRYHSDEEQISGDQFIDFIHSPSTQGKDSTIETIMKNETDCLIPDDAEMIQSLSSMELVGEQRCQNKNRIPGLTYPYQGLEFLEIKFSQSINNLINNDITKLSLDNPDYIFIIKSSRNDYLYGLNQINAYLINNLIDFTSKVATTLLTFFIVLTILIFVVSLIFIVPLPKFFRDITQRTEWIDEFTQSVSKRIILNDEIFFNESLTMDVPRIDNAIRNITKTMTLVVQQMNEEMRKILIIWNEMKKLNNKLKNTIKKKQQINNNFLNQLRDESLTQNKCLIRIQLYLNVILWRIMTHFSDQENLMNIFKQKDQIISTHYDAHVQIIRNYIKFHSFVIKRFHKAIQMLNHFFDVMTQDSIKSGSEQEQQEIDQGDAIIKALPRKNELFAFSQTLLVNHFIKEDRGFMLFLSERVCRDVLNKDIDLDQFSEPFSSKSFFETSTSVSDQEKQYYESIIEMINQTIYDIKLNIYKS